MMLFGRPSSVREQARISKPIAVEITRVGSEASAVRRKTCILGSVLVSGGDVLEVGPEAKGVFV